MAFGDASREITSPKRQRETGGFGEGGRFLRWRVGLVFGARAIHCGRSVFLMEPLRTGPCPVREKLAALVAWRVGRGPKPRIERKG